MAQQAAAPDTGNVYPIGLVEPFETMVREREAESLSQFAVRSYDTRGRAREEVGERGNDGTVATCSVRTPFQVDRDRIAHSKAFRRLGGKTQVFIAPAGDHYRTRASHTLDVTGISRTIARALALNEDLAEAIALGHDLGHTPFGHTGEEALDAVVSERYGWRFLHNEQSLRTVDVLEKDGQGLNLCDEVRDGILNHRGDGLPYTLEGRIVRIADRIAYINHDIDDALRAGMLDHRDLPESSIRLLGDTPGERIDTIVHDMVRSSRYAGDIVQGEEVGRAMHELREFMFESVYLGAADDSDKERVAAVMPIMLDHYIAQPDEVPPYPADDAIERRAADFIAGMTDRFCLRTLNDEIDTGDLPLPTAWGE